jgi:phenylalanyl-tRNA synthetase beta chain
MLVPVSWLKKLVPNKLTSSQLADLLTVAGIEVEHITAVGVYSPHVVCGRLLEKQQLAVEGSVWQLTLDVGLGSAITVVAKSAVVANLTRGVRLAVALAGAVLVDRQDQGFALLPVKKNKCYGVQSEGMLCSPRSLGLGDDDRSLVSLSEELELGCAVRNELEVPVDSEADEILELAILANIARCQSMWGVAREVAALTDFVKTREPSFDNLPASTMSLQPRIDETGICRRFSLAHIVDLQVLPSPVWLQRHLLLAGIRPINNVVDASNYVMLEMGQPLHAYDATQLPTFELCVRLSRQGDALHTLAQEAEADALQLAAGYPVIAVGDQILALAGVIGGSASAVNDKTQSVLLEAANFDYIAIRRSQADSKIFTESSARFSRGVDPSLTLDAIQRFLQILRYTCPQAALLAWGDEKAFSAKPRAISLTQKQVKQTLGIELDVEEIAALLAKLNIACAMDTQRQAITAAVGLDREDIHASCDLLEEIARLYGYDKLPATMPSQPIVQHPQQTDLRDREKIRDALVNAGLQEVLSYSMTSVAAEARLFAATKSSPLAMDYVHIQNPITEDRSVLRRSLLPALLQHVARNLRFTDACHLFEIGRVFLPERSGESALLPAEPHRLAAVMTGVAQPGSWHEMQPRAVDFYDLADIAHYLFAHLHIQDMELEPTTHPMFRLGCCANVTAAGKSYGTIGVVHDLVLQAFGIETATVMAMDLDLDLLLTDKQRQYQVLPLLRYPSIELDISIEVDASISAQWLLSLVRRQGGELLQDVDVFDVYQSDQLGENKKAIALRLLFNAITRTLTTEAACEVRDRIVNSLAQEVGAKLRDG